MKRTSSGLERLRQTAFAVLVGLTAGATSAAAAGPEFSANLSIANDYIFRGFSQSKQDPVVQGGLDVAWTKFYAGIWASRIDFGQALNPSGAMSNIASTELDIYGGMTFDLGPAKLDIGLIYYLYPGAFDPGAELDYLEIKAGLSGDLIKDQVTAGLTVFYSPEYTGKTGEVWTVEGALSVSLPKIGIASPSISGLVGYQAGDQAGWQAIFANGDSSYVYWNVGLSLGFMDDKFALDFRYWDTNISDTNTALATTNFCTGQFFRCNERFVMSATVSY